MNELPQAQAQALEKLGRWVIRTAGRLMRMGPGQRWQIHIDGKGSSIKASYTFYEDQL